MRRSKSVPLIVALAATLLVACGDDAAQPSGPEVTFADPSGATTDAPTTSATASTEPVATAGDPSNTDSDTTPPATVAAEPDVPVLGSPVAVLVEPVDLAVRPGDAGLYIVERPGRVQVLRDGAPATVVLDISNDTVNQGERGLLGLAFASDGATAYVNYTDLDGTTVIESFPVAPDGTFDPVGRLVIITIDQPYANHNGGAVLIGPDGMLWVPTGDGGAGGDPQRLALDVGNLLGKILRIEPLPEGGYDVPEDNPFVGVEGARPEIWSVGLRNPWRVSFDRHTSDLWIADVGQNAIEEVSVAWADEGLGRGVSFGWSAYEGTERFNDDQPSDGHVPPVFEYPHQGNGCSISGGVRYRGEQIAGLQGSYVFGDFCSGRVWALPVGEDRQVGQASEIAQVSSVSAVGQGPDGELYVLSLAGEVYPVIAARP